MPMPMPTASGLRSTAVDPAECIKSGGPQGGRRHSALRQMLVVAQVAFSVMLVVLAGLFAHSLAALRSVELGFRSQNVIGFFLEIPGSWKPDQSAAARDGLLARLETLPGVSLVSFGMPGPFRGGSSSSSLVVPGSELTAREPAWVSMQEVAPRYFEIIGSTPAMGREFTRTDTATAPKVAVVNQTFVHRFLGSADPIGRTFYGMQEGDYPTTLYEIVGVIPDTLYNDLRGQTPPMTFEPASQLGARGPWSGLMIYSNAPPAAIGATIKRRLAARHPDVIVELSDFQRDIRDELTPERLMAMLSGFFGLLAAVLAMVGLYGVISFLVARRRNEIGIRLALGAERGQVIAMVMREAGRLLLIGIAIGVALSLVAGRGARALLFGLKPYDPLTLAVAALLLALIATAASFLPARRASKLDPMAALRDE